MIHLNVPFLEKDYVKSLGARWDPAKKSWYVPAGLEVALFARWLPPDFEFTTSVADHIELAQAAQASLANYLAHISGIINEACATPTWVIAEISELRLHNGIAYLSLVEHNASGMLIARSNARIWQRSLESIFSKFQQSTGIALVAGIKVLINISASFHPAHGFALTIEDIDPSYTLGDMAAKIAQIREQLQSEQIYALNKSLTLPKDFCLVAVISPNAAAGLGDFKREAEVLAKYNLCQFDYYPAIFQGLIAASNIVEQLDTIITSGIAYDAVVIIRGGGALADLAWLNDLVLARAVCTCYLPVMVGIGHERDFTILDEIACSQFDTPSKVAAKIFTTVTNNALAGEQAFKEILQQARQQVLHAEFMSSEIYKHLRQNLLHRVTLSLERIENTYRTMQTAGLTILAKQMASCCEIIQQIHLLATSQVKQASAALTALISSILLQDPQHILQRGYVLVTAGHKPVTSRAQAVQHSELVLAFKDGQITVGVK